MAIDFPENRKEIQNRMASDVQNELPQSDPFLRNSFLSALIVAAAGRIYDFTVQQQQLLIELFPDTATGLFLERWGSYVGITRNPATQANGLVTFSGVAASAIPLGTTVQSSTGLEYTTQTAVVISANNISVTSITRVGSTATVTTVSDHNLASGIDVTISGANEPEYNVTETITVIAADQFTYEVAGSPATPATGTIIASFNTASVEVKSTGFGKENNQLSGTALTLTTPLAGVDDTAYVQFSEIGNGTDIETDDDLRTRILERYQNPVAMFNVAAIVAKAKEVSGVTRVFVLEAGDPLETVPVTSAVNASGTAFVTTTVPHNFEDGQHVTITGANEPEYNQTNEVLFVFSPTVFLYHVPVGAPAVATGTLTAFGGVRPGQVYVYFVRDNDVNIIPSASEVTAVKDKILEIKPAHTSSTDVIVLAPTPITIDFTFTALSPNTTTMQTAITQSLQQFFREQVEVGKDIVEDSYQCAIFGTIDSETGDRITSFTLSAPVGDIIINPGEMPVLGTIAFP